MELQLASAVGRRKRLPLALAAEFRYVGRTGHMPSWNAGTILSILDACCDDFSFPMLDNGYIYPAAARLSAYRSPEDWAIVIESFGYSPRHGVPSVIVSTFASTLVRPDLEVRIPVALHRENYLTRHPNDDTVEFFPLGESRFQDPDCDELVADDVREVLLRGTPVPIPRHEAFASMGIPLLDPPSVAVFELCRALAHDHRDAVLASPEERRAAVPRELDQLLLLNDWHHPAVALESERPSRSETFRLLTEALECGDASRFRPTVPPNTHWINWPDGGSL